MECPGEESESRASDEPKTRTKINNNKSKFLTKHKILLRIHLTIRFLPKIPTPTPTHKPPMDNAPLILIHPQTKIKPRQIDPIMALQILQKTKR